MKRFYLILIALLTMVATVSAKQISQETALATAKQFDFEKSLTTVNTAVGFNLNPVYKSNFTKSNDELELVYTATDGTHNFFYVYNRGVDEGFIIVSADDCIRKNVLGYSNEGYFDPNDIPSNMQWWLDCYAHDIKDAILYVEANPMTATVKAETASFKPAISTLVPTRWNQGFPYNILCPMVDGKNQRSATGCVATAMAQVMFYHKHPAENKKTGRKYDWTNMKERYSGSETDAQNKAVAQLMSDAGVSVNMDYGESSGAYNTDVPLAMIDYFDYDKTIMNLSRSVYSTNGWADLIYSELEAKRPVMYFGQSKGGGHAFVCDGYDGKGKFHINWGWGGSSDGYFELSDLNPYNQGIGGSSTNDGFNKQNTIVAFVKPNKNEMTDYTMYGIMATGDISYKETSAGNVSFNLKPGNFNTGTITATKGNIAFSGYFALCAVNKTTNNLTEIKIFSLSGLGAGSYYPNFSSTFAGPESKFKELSAGDYKVGYFYKRKNIDTEWQPVIVAPNVVNYVDLTVSASKQLTFTDVTPVKPSISFSNITVQPTFYVGGMYEISADITCSKADYDGKVAIIIRNKASKLGIKTTYHQSASTNLSLQNGETKTITIVDQIDATEWETNNGVAGTCQLVFVDADDKEISNATDITVSDDPGDARVALTGFSVPNSQNVIASKFELNVSFNITDGYFLGNSYSFALLESGAQYINTIFGDFNLFGEGAKSFNIKKDLSDNVEVGKTYNLYLGYLNGNSFSAVANPVTFTVGALKSGITNVEKSTNDGIAIFPNPATDVINIKNDNTIKEVKIYSIGGAEVLTKAVAGNNCNVNIENLPLGSYIVKVITNDDILMSRIIKK